MLLPGLLPADPALERYRVHPGAVTAVELDPGDVLTVIDEERPGSAGSSPCWPAGPRTTGRSAPSPTPPPPSLRALAASAVTTPLAERGLDPGQARAVALFGEWSPPGTRAEFAAARHLVAVVAAPGGPMSVAADNPPSDLVLEVRRVSPRRPEPRPLPPPLADVTLDLRVPAAQARAYRVKAGDYIQIIDVDGQQCSDFLAFDAAQLADGIEKGLDATTTRTLMGSAYPGPGLHSKYYDEDMRPLIEVVRDTVGRHDTFALACTAKYYEDAGYPGHPNCSDNFNAVLKPYSIRERRGWPAINFFYNTSIEPSNALTSDEPWSRPGDYVLLRALTDLVCASSSCADDIDPANGWCPTDIHVRVYDGGATFSKGSALRMTPDAEPRLTRETAFHPRLQALTRNFVDYRGFWLPTCFTGRGPIEEYWACRDGVAVMDLSPLRKFEVMGPDAEQLLQRTVTRNILKLAVGQVVYTALCYEHGGMIDDATVMRLGPNNFRVIAGDDFTGLWLRQKAEEWGLKVWVKSSTDQLHNLAVQGPKSRDLLAGVIWTPPSQPAFAELEWFRFTIGRLGARGPP